MRTKRGRSGDEVVQTTGELLNRVQPRCHGSRRHPTLVKVLLQRARREEQPAHSSVAQLDGVRLRGLMGYEGHVMGMEPLEKERETRVSGELLQRARHAAEAAGIPVGVLSGGGSGNYRFVLQQRLLTELQAGGAALMDLTYEQMGVEGHRRAFALSAQVVSATQGRAAADAGWKATGRHTGLPQVVAPDGARCVGLSAEHTHLALDDGASVRPGDRIRLIPHYSDSTMLLHRTLYAHREGVVEAAWPITGAGALQ